MKKELKLEKRVIETRNPKYQLLIKISEDKVSINLYNRTHETIVKYIMLTYDEAKKLAEVLLELLYLHDSTRGA
ncbi:MAG: hypothetical protein QXD45_06240 [Candidatus Bathyarchaeia archaeon]